MIEKMKFLSITGPKEDIDRVVEEYLSKYPIHLENALAELGQVKNLYPYIQANPYRDSLNKAREYMNMLPESDVPPPARMTVQDSVALVDEIEEKIREKKKNRERLEAECKEKEELMRQLLPYRAIPMDIEKLLRFRYIKLRFGRIPAAYYERFKKYVHENLDIIFYKCLEEKEYIWGIYFVPQPMKDRADAVMSSLHFERIFLPDSYKGNGAEAYKTLENEVAVLHKEIKEEAGSISTLLSSEAAKLAGAVKTLDDLTFNFDVRKLAACTKEKKETFYILCGWMTEKDAEAFQKAIEGDANIFCIVEDGDANVYATPPTKLKNPKIFKPFEMYTRMYGLPGYREMDPTIFLALTYAFTFGAMFGDLGQGLFLVVAGFALYKFKKMDLAAIIGTAGIFSAFFGLMFGSVFGFEDKIDAIWLRPKEAMSQIPFVGTLNTVLIVAIVFGMGLVLVTMIFQMINAWKCHDLGSFLFSPNGLAGFLFYGFLVLVIVLYMTGHALPATVLLVLMLGIPVILMALREPLTRAIEKEKPLIPGGVGMYVVETFFELFEVMLSYFSNTLSFVRVGAFAISHAAMMEVVLMLAGAENGGSPNWIVVVLGNLFVCGMEGLIVGIQVLRLEYYEMFSRYYKGDGREFKPFGRRQA